MENEYDGVMTRGFVVTPSDTVTYNPPLVGLYCGGTGDITVDLAGNKPGSLPANVPVPPAGVTFKAVPAGVILPIIVTRVWAAGTSATSITAMLP